MSMFSIERIIWEIQDSRERAEEFLNDPDQLLAQYGLSSTERDLVKSKNVRAMAEMEVSQLLLLGFWSAVSGGQESVPEYLQRMNGVA